MTTSSHRKKSGLSDADTALALRVGQFLVAFNASATDAEYTLFKFVALAHGHATVVEFDPPSAVVPAVPSASASAPVTRPWSELFLPVRPSLATNASVWSLCYLGAELSTAYYEGVLLPAAKVKGKARERTVRFNDGSAQPIPLEVVWDGVTVPAIMTVRSAHHRIPAARPRLCCLR